MSSTFEFLQVKQNGCVLSLTLNRAESGNALTPALVEQIITALENAKNVSLCVIRGNGNNFCTGFDLSDLDGLSDGDLLHRILRIETMLQMVYHSTFPILAIAHGHAIGAGADLFAASTFRVATSGIKFKMPGWNFELALGTRRLVRIVGADEARDLLIDTRTITADKALEIGLVTELKDKSEWDDTIALLATRCSTLSPFGNANMLDLTATDTRHADIAAIVKTAGRPGLKDRIKSYQQYVVGRRQARRKEADNG